jgi:hypothetical protein
VHKDFLTSCETLIAMRVIHPLDRNAIKDWIDGCPDADKGREVLQSLASLPRGTGWVWSPEIGFGPTRIAFPMFKTYDSFKAPTGEEAKLKGWAAVDLDDVKAKLATVVQEAAANDPKRLRARIAELERELRKPREVAVDVEALRREYQRGQTDALRMFKIELLPVMNRCDEALATLTTYRGMLDILALAQWIDVERMSGSAVANVIEKTDTRPPVKHDGQFDKKRISAQSASSGTNGAIPKGERAILIALAQHPDGCARDQLSILTGYKRSSRDAYVQRLRERGYCETGGELVMATPAGIKALGNDFEPLPTGSALLEHWLGRLPPGEAAILRLVADKYPRAAEREWLSGKSGYQRSSRDAYIQRLRARKLVTPNARGEVIASDALFG